MSLVTEVFGREYAGVYDAIYRNKDYEREVDLIERILRRHGLDGQRRVLDLGCGTGGHAVLLARRGHAVLGVDRSSAMLELAREKVAAEPPECTVAFCQGDIRQLDLGRRFEVVLMMFTVLGYQREDVDLSATLATVRRHIAPGGLFIFDVWNGLAVLASGPSDRLVTVVEGAGRITRKTRAELDLSRHLCNVYFDLERTNSDGQVKQWREVHVMRYYFAEELKAALLRSDLELLNLRSFPDDERPADERAWNVVGVARAKEADPTKFANDGVAK